MTGDLPSDPTPTGNSEEQQVEAMEYVYCVEARKQSIDLPQLGVRCDDAETPHPIGVEASDYFTGMTQLIHSRPARNRFDEPIQVSEELRGLFTACVFDRMLAVIVRPGSEALASRWFVLDLATVDVSPGVWQPGVFRRPPGSLIIEAPGLTMKVVEPARYFATGESITQQSAAMMETLRRQGLAMLGLAQGDDIDLDDPESIARTSRWPFPPASDVGPAPLADVDDAPPPQVTGCE